MADQDIPPPLPVQIVAQTLELLEQRHVFKPNEIEALSRLADTTGFRKPDPIIALLKGKEVNNETP